MSDTNAFTFLMLPPQTALTRQWGKRLADTVPGMKLIVAEDMDTAAAAIVTADAAFGTLPAELLAKAHACAGCKRRKPHRPLDTTTRNLSPIS